MKKIRLLTIFVTLGMLLSIVLPAGAVPGLPSPFTGLVTLNGSAVASGTVVTAWINGFNCGQATVVATGSDMSYILPVRTQDADDPLSLHCGVNGDTVFFTIGATNIVADLTGSFTSGGAVVTLNLGHTGNSKPFAYGQSVVASQFTDTPITLTSSDPEADALTYVNLGSPLLGTLTGTMPSLTFTPNGDDYGLDSFVFRVREGVSPTYLYSFYAKVFITVDDPPTDISLSDSLVAENLAVNTVVGTLSSTDPNFGTIQNSFTYSLVTCTGAPDNASFNILNDTLRTSAVFDAGIKTDYSVCIRTTDNFGLSFDKVFPITVVDPTAVNLKSFTAVLDKIPVGVGKDPVTIGKKAILLSWETTSEVNNLGFNLYRATSVDGPRTKLNASLIPTKLNPGSLLGATYGYRDRTVKNNTTYYYWLESVEISGGKHLTDPVSVKAVIGKIK